MPPYGYRPVDGKPGHLEVMPEEADAIRWAAQQIIAGVGLDTIGRQLDELGFPTRAAPRWSRQVVRGIFSSDAVAGLRTHTTRVCASSVSVIDLAPSHRAVTGRRKSRAGLVSLVHNGLHETRKASRSEVGPPSFGGCSRFGRRTRRVDVSTWRRRCGLRPRVDDQPAILRSRVHVPRARMRTLDDNQVVPDRSVTGPQFLRSKATQDDRLQRR